MLKIRSHIDPLPRGGLLEIRSTEISVKEDLPAWCRLTDNELVSVIQAGRAQSFLVCKGALSERRTQVSYERQVMRGLAHASVPAGPGDTSYWPIG